MAVTEIATYTVRPEVRQEFDHRVPAALDVLVSHPACLGVSAYQQMGDPTTYTFLITWSSPEGHDAWRTSAERDRFRALIVELLAAPVAFADYELRLSR